MASELAKAAQQANWSQLQIKGAIASLKSVARCFRVGTYDYDRCMSTLTKLESLLVNQVKSDYAITKLLITGERLNSKK